MVDIFQPVPAHIQPAPRSVPSCAHFDPPNQLLMPLLASAVINIAVDILAGGIEFAAGFLAQLLGTGLGITDGLVALVLGGGVLRTRD